MQGTGALTMRVLGMISGTSAEAEPVGASPVSIPGSGIEAR